MSLLFWCFYSGRRSGPVLFVTVWSVVCMDSGSSDVLDPLPIGPAWSPLSTLCQQLETMTCLPLDSLSPPVWHLSLMTRVWLWNQTVLIAVMSLSCLDVGLRHIEFLPNLSHFSISEWNNMVSIYIKHFYLLPFLIIQSSTCLFRSIYALLSFCHLPNNKKYY